MEENQTDSREVPSDLDESKSVGNYRRPKRDLRALEITAYNKVYGKQASKIKKAARPKAAKSLDAVKIEFRKNLSKEIAAFKDGKIAYTTLVRRSATTFRQTYEQSFRLGLEAQGVGKLTSPSSRRVVGSQPTPADIKWIDGAVKQELAYWNKFMRAVKTNTLRMPLPDRLDMYVRTVDSVFTAGRVQGSPDTSIISWVFGDAEHCKECVLLESLSPFTKDSLPTTPRAGDTRCLSNCKCKLVIKRAPLHIYQAIARRQRPKTFTLKVLEVSRRTRTLTSGKK